MQVNGSYRHATDPHPTQASTQVDPFWRIMVEQRSLKVLQQGFGCQLLEGLGFCVLFWNEGDKV